MRRERSADWNGTDKVNHLDTRNIKKVLEIPLGALCDSVVPFLFSLRALRPLRLIKQHRAAHLHRQAEQPHPDQHHAQQQQRPGQEAR